MGVDVSKLKPEPSLLSKGVTEVVMKFFGLVDGAADNPVKLRLMIEPAATAFFRKGDSRVKSLDSQRTFKMEPTLEKWEVKIEVTETPQFPTACSIRLEATDQAGNRSSVNSFIIYH